MLVQLAFAGTPQHSHITCHERNSAFGDIRYGGISKFIISCNASSTLATVKSSRHLTESMMSYKLVCSKVRRDPHSAQRCWDQNRDLVPPDSSRLLVTEPPVRVADLGLRASERGRRSGPGRQHVEPIHDSDVTPVLGPG